MTAPAPEVSELTVVPAEPKAGLLTTEFWLALAVIVCATVLAALSKIDAQAWTAATGAVSAGYALSRGLAKR